MGVGFLGKELTSLKLKNFGVTLGLVAAVKNIHRVQTQDLSAIKLFKYFSENVTGSFHVPTKAPKN